MTFNPKNTDQVCVCQVQTAWPWPTNDPSVNFRLTSLRIQ